MGIYADDPNVILDVCLRSISITLSPIAYVDIYRNDLLDFYIDLTYVYIYTYSITIC